MIEVIHEHSVEVSLLPAKANILDLGCRDFGFTNAMRERGHIVWPVDIDDLQTSEHYYRCAISNYDGKCGIVKTPDPQGTRIGKGDSIPCYTLETFSKMQVVEFWDLIKMDVEGSEEEIILSMEKPMAKQISVEMHLHCGQSTEAIGRIKTKTGWLGYDIVVWDYSEKHGAGFNVWDALFILR